MRNICLPAATDAPDGRFFFINWLLKHQCGLSIEHLGCPGLCVATTAHSPGKNWEEPFSWKRNSRVSTLPLPFLLSFQRLLLWVPMLIHWILGLLFILACIRCLVWGLEINSGLCVSATSPSNSLNLAYVQWKKKPPMKAGTVGAFVPSEWLGSLVLEDRYEPNRKTQGLLCVEECN